MTSHKILFVDDEENILRTLRRIFRKDDYEILTATGGAEGLEILRDNDVAVVVSDQRMPHMNGAEFLKRVKQISPEAIRMILTGYADIKATMAAINDGEVYRYITKPWKEDEFRQIIREAVQKYDLQQENKRLRSLIVKQNKMLKKLTDDLEEEVLRKNKELIDKNQHLEKLNKELEDSIFETIAAFSGLLERRDFYVGSHSKRVANASKFIAKQMGLSEEEVKRVEMAGMLHDIGKIGIPDPILQKLPAQMTKNEILVYQTHPIIGQTTLVTIKSLEPVSLMVRHHHEMLNGTGFPDKLRGEEIPLGARIVAVPNTFDNLIFHRGTYRQSIEKEAIRYLRANRNILFEEEAVNHFVDYLEAQSEEEKKANERKVHVNELREGMVLTRDVYTAKGVLLAPKGERLKKNYITRIIQYDKIDPIIEGIYVQ